LKTLNCRKAIRKVSTRQRADLAYAAKVRAKVHDRDEGCRVGKIGDEGKRCFGSTQCAHMEGKRRSQTRRMAPEQRHSTAWEIELCMFHAMLEETKQMKTAYLSDRGADGPMRFELVRTGRTLWEIAA
jgi:hypothetical protein